MRSCPGGDPPPLFSNPFPPLPCPSCCGTDESYEISGGVISEIILLPGMLFDQNDTTYQNNIVSLHTKHIPKHGTRNAW